METWMARFYFRHDLFLFSFINSSFWCNCSSLTSRSTTFYWKFHQIFCGTRSRLSWSCRTPSSVRPAGSWTSPRTRSTSPCSSSRPPSHSILLSLSGRPSPWMPLPTSSPTSSDSHWTIQTSWVGRWWVPRVLSLAAARPFGCCRSQSYTWSLLL